MNRVFTRSIIVLTLILPSMAAHAVLRIEITQGVSQASPIAVVPFGWHGTGAPPATDVAKVVSDDLARSGRFKALPVADMLGKPTQANDINFTNWRTLSVDNLVIGRIRQVGQGYAVDFQLFNVYTGRQLLGYSIPTTPARLRYTAHLIADKIYQKLTGVRGAFATRIAYVSVNRVASGTKYALVVADADGANAQTILRSVQPIMSPAWSPDGKRLAYVSFENKHPQIYIQTLATGKRRLISNRTGLNGAPAFSPNGRQLAMVLSSAPGNPDIYIMDLASGKLTRVTRDPAIDTEPDWLPDGKHLVFTSDRGGSPQIYEVDIDSGQPQRLTFEGNYNARPEVSPDGKLLAMVHRENGRFQIAVMDMQTGALQVLTEGHLDEAPSFAPNGQMIIYATESGGRDILAAVSVDGRVRQRLALTEGDVREPVWSPFMQ